MRIFVHLETKISKLDDQTLTTIVCIANTSSVGLPIGLMCNSKT